jgi:hypothetical protein
MDTSFLLWASNPRPREAEVRRHFLAWRAQPLPESRHAHPDPSVRAASSLSIRAGLSGRIWLLYTAAVGRRLLRPKALETVDLFSTQGRTIQNQGASFFVRRNLDYVALSVGAGHAPVGVMV